MDNFLGDLTDIIRASGGASYGSRSCSTGTTSSEATPFSHDDHHHWQLSYDHHPMINFSSVLEDPLGNFGDPFSNTRDPFLHELGTLGSAHFNSTSSKGLMEEAGCFGGGVIDTSNSSVLAQEILEDDDMKRPCNSMLFNMTQISANAKLAKPSAVVSGNMINANTSSDHCLMDNTGVQISFPRNYPGLKRRKSQAKKSICIPAPTAPNSRQSGEVVPSDLWAWRKYGQKPIKGSPYPRSYYRCSSSKGCPARKQVERSRTDPNMLVITYTSEHNHAWPTQRNALAGSTRSQQQSKKTNANSKNSETTQPQKGTTKKQGEEQQEFSNSDSNVLSSEVAAAGNSSSKGASVKEEINDIKKHQLENEMDDAEFSNGLSKLMKCNQLEDFFEELGEAKSDSLDLLQYPKCFNAVDDRESKGVDPFHLFDWSGDNNTKYHLI